jgi:hypothetical protein
MTEESLHLLFNGFDEDNHLKGSRTLNPSCYRILKMVGGMEHMLVLSKRFRI